jgi:inosine/xanthosine triphosphate pyrophosphatase family protein
MAVFIVSSNQKKISDAKSVFPTIQTFKTYSEFKEPQTMNAQEIVKGKLDSIKNLCDMSAFFIVEDTFLYMDELNGFPGPYIKDFYNSVGPYKIVDKFGGTNLTVKSHIGVLHNGQTKFVTGEQKGKLVTTAEKILADKTYDFDCMVEYDGGERIFRNLALHKVKQLIEEWN